MPKPRVDKSPAMTPRRTKALYLKDIEPLIDKVAALCEKHHIAFIGCVSWEHSAEQDEVYLAQTLCAHSPVQMLIAFDCLMGDFDHATKAITAVNQSPRGADGIQYVDGPLDEIAVKG